VSPRLAQRRGSARTGALLCALLLPLCWRGASSASKPPQEYLDEETGATITVVAEPLVFAAARPDLAANVRDYVTLAAAAVDLNRKVSYVLIGYFWSTVDPRLRRDPPRLMIPLVLQADDRRIELALRGNSAHEAGIGVPVHAPAGAAVPPNVFATDLATLRFLAEARRLTLVADSAAAPLGYELWEDRRPALRAFVRQMNGD
jgi:hypothetical protein